MQSARKLPEGKGQEKTDSNLHHGTPLSPDPGLIMALHHRADNEAAHHHRSSWPWARGEPGSSVVRPVIKRMAQPQFTKNIPEEWKRGEARVQACVRACVSTKPFAV